MTHFWHGVGTWLASIWSHHPHTWQTWAVFIYMATVTVWLLLVVFTRHVNVPLLFVVGLSAAATAVGYATLHDTFRFWAWSVLAVILLIRPVATFQTYRKKKKAAATSHG